jgi:hypothetical protein
VDDIKVNLNKFQALPYTRVGWIYQRIDQHRVC